MPNLVQFWLRPYSEKEGSITAFKLISLPNALDLEFKEFEGLIVRYITWYDKNYTILTLNQVILCI